VDASAEPVDSALAKASQPVDSVIAKSSSGAAAVVSRAGGAVESALGKRNALADQIAEGLESGRVAIPEITFHAGTSVFADDAEPALAALGDALAQIEGTFLIEGHVAPDAARDVAALRPLSAARAMAVKEWLTAAGIDASRLVTLGAGATREPGEGGIADRIELVAVR
jgi:outer membrane protein OmpA-like peptidoglycan-associated protein